MSLEYPQDICTDRQKKAFPDIAWTKLYGNLAKFWSEISGTERRKAEQLASYIILSRAKHQFGRIIMITKILSVVPYQKAYSVTGLHSSVWEYLYAGTCEFEHVLCSTCIPAYFTSRFHSFQQE